MWYASSQSVTQGVGAPRSASPLLLWTQHCIYVFHTQIENQTFGKHKCSFSTAKHPDGMPEYLRKSIFWNCCVSIISGESRGEAIYSKRWIRQLAALICKLRWSVTSGEPKNSHTTDWSSSSPALTEQMAYVCGYIIVSNLLASLRNKECQDR